MRRVPLAAFAALICNCPLFAHSAQAEGPESFPDGMQICVSSALPDYPDDMLAQVGMGTGVLDEGAVYRSQAKLITEGAKPLLSEEAVTKGCDLVIEAGLDEKPSYYVLESAPDGPMADIKATLQLLGAAKAQLSGIMFTQVDLVQDAELLDLIRQELDELASSQGLDIGPVPHYACAKACQRMPAQ